MQVSQNDFDSLYNPIYDLNTRIELDQSTAMEDWQEYTPSGSVESSPITIRIPPNPTQFTDLRNSYIRVELEIGAVKANSAHLVSMVNNAFMTLVTQVIIRLNGVEIEQQSTAVHEVNTMYNLLHYSAQFSTDGSGLERGWMVDDHTFFTSSAADNTPATGISPGGPIVSFGTISGGVDNCCNGIEFSISTINTLRVERNKKYSSGWKGRHDYLFKGFEGVYDVTPVDNDNYKSGYVTFKIPLHHISPFCNSLKSVVRGPTFEIEFHMDPRNSVGGNYNFFSNYTLPLDGGGFGTFPPTFQAMAPANVIAPDVVSGQPPGQPNYAIQLKKMNLVARVLTPTEAIMRDLSKKFIEGDKHQTLTFSGHHVGTRVLPAGSQENQFEIPAGSRSKVRWLVLAFRIENATSNGPGTLGAGKRSTTGASNYGTFDNCDIRGIQVTYGGKNFPMKLTSSNIAQKNILDYLKYIDLYRKESLGLDDEFSSTGTINFRNWKTLYPLYVVDMRAQDPLVVGERSGQTELNVKITYNKAPITNTRMTFFTFYDKVYRINTVEALAVLS